MTIVDRIKEKGQLYNMTIASIERTTGIGNGTIAKWNERKPSADSLYKVAVLLNVSMEYLLTGQEKNDNFSPSEHEWLRLYYQLSEHDKIECAKFIKGYIAGTNSHNIV